MYLLLWTPISPPTRVHCFPYLLFFNLLNSWHPDRVIIIVRYVYCYILRSSHSETKSCVIWNYFAQAWCILDVFEGLYFFSRLFFILLFTFKNEPLDCYPDVISCIFNYMKEKRKKKKKGLPQPKTLELFDF